jgi:hypothetical protein
MRRLMAFLTLGAGAIGYAYLQQAPAAGESGGKPSNSLFDTGGSKSSRPDSSRGSVKDLVNQIHEHTKSILDDFVSQHGGHSDAPADNAYQRLKQVSTDSLSVKLAQTDRLKNSSHSAPSKLDDLQRMAFDPAVVVDLPAILTNAASEDADSSLTDTVSQKADSPIHVVASSLEPTPKTSSIDSSPRRKSAITGTKTNRSVAGSAAGITEKARFAEWKVVGKTTERRPMHSMHLGAEGTRTLVIAGLDGQDRVAVRWLEQLAEAMAKRPDLLVNNEVLFFRAGNPDGLVRKVNSNVRGVSINRNFPSRRYRPMAGLPNFAVPASEAETRVILDTLYSFRPRRVIHLVSTSGKSQVIYNRLAKDLAIELERSSELRITPLDPEQLPGSIEDFSDGTLEAAVLSMRLNVGTDWQLTWTNLQPAVLSALSGRRIDNNGKESSVQQDPDGSPLPLPPPNVDPVSRRRGRRGYEELPAPPE